MIAHAAHRLLNDYQHRFPLVPRPFDALARELDASPRAVLERLRALQADGTVSRVGPVFRPNTIGVSTLAAMAVPATALDEVARLVNGYPEVNHNYEREHCLNMWFVAAAETGGRLRRVLSDIERRCGCMVLSMPLVRDYHIDLGFPLAGDADGESPGGVAPASSAESTHRAGTWTRLAGNDKLICAIQGGLPLVERPYRDCGRPAGLSESEIISGIEALCGSGIIKRFGIVVRHHELGYRANAMVAWDVPDPRADAIGPDLGARADVTLCYRRIRRPPQWPYNLFCMIHGKCRDRVSARIEELSRDLDLTAMPRAILFSTRRFKQRGALYARSATQAATHG